MSDFEVFAEMNPNILKGLRVKIVKCLCPVCADRYGASPIRRDYCIFDDIGAEYTVVGVSDKSYLLSTATVIIDKSVVLQDNPFTTYRSSYPWLNPEFPVSPAEIEISDKQTTLEDVFLIQDSDQ